MKRFIAVVMTLVLVLTVFPASVNAEEIKTDELFVEYDEFCENKDYYWGLVGSRQCTVYVHIDDKHVDEVSKKFETTSNQRANIGAGNSTYGSSIPSELWNVATQGTYNIPHSYAFASQLYSEYKYHGVRSYGIAIFNESETEDLVVYPAGGLFEYGEEAMTVYPRYAMLKLLVTKYTSTQFYLRYQVPAYGFFGYVGEYSVVSELL